MSDKHSTITHRAEDGFGEAFNNAVPAPPPNIGPPKLLQLPDELLLTIAMNLDGRSRNKDLRNLALTCHRFRGVAQEILICNAILTPDAVCRNLELLFEHPEHIHKLPSHLDLLGRGYRSDDIWYPTSDDFAQAYGEVMIKTCGLGYGLDWIKDFSRGAESRTSACLAILILLRPRLEHLSISDHCINECILFSKCVEQRIPVRFRIFGYQPTASSNIPQWRTLIINTFAPKLLTLEVVDTSYGGMLNRLGFRKFQNLRQLSVSADHIIFLSRAHALVPLYEPSDPIDVLPNSLRSLQIYVEDFTSECGSIYEWLEKLRNQQNAFPLLRTIRLFFKVTLQAFQNYSKSDSTERYWSRFSDTSNQAKHKLELLESWRDWDISLEMFFLKLEGPPRPEGIDAWNQHYKALMRTPLDPDANDLCHFLQVPYNHVLEGVR
ncbi:uncharacterized protein K460DRAFT_353678 [Cucurbitaria berberidis CBS 394.84]|uniref:F-box domain-containing protein n=1 Tax=Cucurbitaria berberidis CBS 394.84 TaxID=1168544 RepID=A0A9P4LB62_9PLEO|nr:uncharacterized protein K460DRAFT_353678 [Cucurbitaria berberidis CBS 394.84]KAF1848735.1 hypothetical protein K460DRAFT_353678 [Cucurbitaria berberidis CBS 394.84]